MVEAAYGAFESAASGFTGAAESIRSGDVASPFGDVQAAMPDSQTLQAAMWLGSRLAAVAVYADDVASLGDLSRATGGNDSDSAGQDLWYAQDVDDVVVLEQVSADGLHQLSLACTEAVLRSDVVVRHWRDQSPPLLGIFSGPGGTYLTEVREGETPVTRPVPATEARRILRESLDAALAQATIDG